MSFVEQFCNMLKRLADKGFGEYREEVFQYAEYRELKSCIFYPRKPIEIELKLSDVDIQNDRIQRWKELAIEKVGNENLNLRLTGRYPEYRIYVTNVEKFPNYEEKSLKVKGLVKYFIEVRSWIIRIT